MCRSRSATTDTVAVRPSSSDQDGNLNIVGGLAITTTPGDLVIDGISTKQYKDRDWDTYRNNRIGFVFQSYNLIPHQTVLANVELALTLSGVSPAERKERAIPQPCARSGWATISTSVRISFPAARCSGSPSPAHSSMIPRSCWPTNRPARSTRRPASKIHEAADPDRRPIAWW